MKKQEIITQIVTLLSQLIETEETSLKSAENAAEKPIEMLTVKECSAQIKGLSEHTVRQLVAQNKIPYIRTGQGKNGKILIAKSALLAYFGGTA
ncbi:MAG: helix-turn-helix domain-containing protein [Ruminococcus sp.]|nr:helix-turn-helix domain-containing protein [Ruminococcus sp.]